MSIRARTVVTSSRMGALRKAIAIVGATLTWLASAGPAVAGPQDPPADVKEEADAHYRQGRELYNRGEWGAALGEFTASRKLRSNWAVVASVAFCQAKLQRYDEALETFEAVLRDFGDALAPQTKADAQAQIDELHRHVGMLEVDRAEPGATITVDGRGRGAYPLTGPLRLAAGAHVVLARKDGFEPYVASIDVAAEHIVHVDARMRLLGSPGQLHVEAQGGRGMTGRQIGALVAGGLGAVGVVIGAITGGMALATKSTVDANCGLGGDPTACNPTGFAAANNLKALSLPSTIGFAVGAAGLATGVVLFVTAPKTKPSGAIRARWVGVEVAPLGVSGAAAGVKGAW